jgi:radical SAM-linked protein
VAKPNPNKEHIPAVQKLRLQHAKRGRLRFTSHRDFQRAFERALRRANIPMAYSSGFNPRPKVSYANAAPTGVASEAEYVEIGVVAECVPAKVLEKLNEVLPPGLDILDVVEAKTSDFVATLEASHWQVEFSDLDTAELQKAIDTFLAESEVLVERVTKSGLRTFDTRQAVLKAALVSPENAVMPDKSEIDPNCAILSLVVRHGTPTVRPDDVLSALSKVASLAPAHPPRMTRLAQGPLLADGWSVGDPFAADRAAS